ncbi:hypothetical protein RNZ50_17240 [Paracoccaceae bacterium Fryx2]|nr:hypothetical protein [Paracoccaceae bacterium Fryx2]
MLFRLMLGFVLLIYGPVAAQDALAPAQGQALLAALPKSVVTRLQRAPGRIVEDAATMIAGLGGPGGLDPGGIAAFVALERAEARTYEMRQMLAADLDNDGAVAAAELAQRIAVESPRAGGCLQLAFLAADADGNGQVDMGELRGHAALRALKTLSDARAADLAALMRFDLDGDGLLTLAEVTAGVAAVLAASEAGKAGEESEKDA